MRIYFDVSVTFRNGLNTGIQRVVRSLAAQDHQNELTLVIGDMSEGDVFRSIERSDFLAARDPTKKFWQKRTTFVLNILRKFRFLMPMVDIIPNAAIFKEIIKERLSPNYTLNKQIQRLNTLKISQKDYYVTFDAFWNTEKDVSRIIEAKRQGAKVLIFVHDILPITHPHLFERSNIKNFKEYFASGVEQADVLFFSSNHVLESFKKKFPISSARKELIPLGADYGGSKSLAKSRDKNSHILMVGTLEPRKNYLEILQWFKETNLSNALIIVGRRGWKSAEIRRMIRKVKRKKKNLVWVQNANDAELSTLIEDAAIGICASLEEGYGLPLREFLAKDLRVVASDIDAFREVGNSGVEYFAPGNRLSLENAVRVALSKSGQHFNVKLDSWLDTHTVLLSTIRLMK
jgi:glycosyltransferase involved in cell wall biosynthesis